jgi:hypothetical protein
VGIFRYGALALLVLLGSSGPSLAQAGPVNLRAKWVDPSSIEDGFRMYRISGADTIRTRMCQVGANILTCDFPDTVTANSCYVVVAYNAAGESPDSLPVCLILPKTPTTLTINAAPATVTTLRRKHTP